MCGVAGTPGLFRGREGLLVPLVCTQTYAFPELQRSPPGKATIVLSLYLPVLSNTADQVQGPEARGGIGVVSGAREGEQIPRGQKLLMEPLNNRPNSLFVCRVGTFSIKRRLNIVDLRVGTWLRRGPSLPWYCFFHW